MSSGSNIKMKSRLNRFHLVGAGINHFLLMTSHTVQFSRTVSSFINHLNGHPAANHNQAFILTVYRRCLFKHTPLVFRRMNQHQNRSGSKRRVMKSTSERLHSAERSLEREVISLTRLEATFDPLLASWFRLRVCLHFLLLPEFRWEQEERSQAEGAKVRSAERVDGGVLRHRRTSSFHAGVCKS